MRIGLVIGNVTMSRFHPTISGGALRLVLPLNLDELTDAATPAAEAIVVYDDLGAGPGSQIAFSEGGEAAQPFYPEDKPVDAYNAAILDTIDVRSVTAVQ
ncbi:MAG TPA: EutN/CcmL family microcompartment protein [Pirellulales bacterium]|jgi:ethanolamine utilization protein EutN